MKLMAIAIVIGAHGTVGDGLEKMEGIRKSQEESRLSRPQHC